jgi:hypothetical protein
VLLFRTRVDVVCVGLVAATDTINSRGCECRITHDCMHARLHAVACVPQRYSKRVVPWLQTATFLVQLGAHYPIVESSQSFAAYLSYFMLKEEMPAAVHGGRPFL